MWCGLESATRSEFGGAFQQRYGASHTRNSVYTEKCVERVHVQQALY
jgi:hypothetical protein